MEEVGESCRGDEAELAWHGVEEELEAVVVEITEDAHGPHGIDHTLRVEAGDDGLGEVSEFFDAGVAVTDGGEGPESVGDGLREDELVHASGYAVGERAEHGLEFGRVGGLVEGGETPRKVGYVLGVHVLETVLLHTVGNRAKEAAVLELGGGESPGGNCKRVRLELVHGAHSAFGNAVGHVV